MPSIGPTLAILIAAIAGAGVAVQAGFNAQLARHIGHPLWASLVSFGLGTLLILPLLASFGVPAPDLARALKGPWWIWLGGAMGLFFVTAALILAPRTGIAVFLAAMVAGQMIASLALDHYGLIGLPVRPLTIVRAAGAALIIAGVLLIQLRQS